MDYQKYETYRFYRSHAFNVATNIEGRSYQNHWHTYGEIIKVGSGDVNIYRINQNTYHLEPDDLVLIWPTEQHEIIDADRKEAVIVQFGNAFAESLFDIPRIMHYFHNLHVIRKKNHPELTEKLIDLIEQMKKIYYSEGRNRESRGCILLFEFMIMLDEYRHELSADMNKDRPISVPDETVKKVAEIADYVKNNLSDDDLTETAMADRAGVSKEYFSKVFKNLSGLNYSKWLNMIRVEHAISLFPNKGMKLTEIAMLSGFQSIPSFNRVFKDLKGISPREYRNMNQN